MEFFADDLRLTIKIILIDMILSADNAIVIGLFASQFDPKIRQKVLVIGTSLAVLFRILFAVLVAYLLQYKGVRTFGAILLFSGVIISEFGKYAYKFILSKMNRFE